MAFVEGPNFVVERVRAHGTGRIGASRERPLWVAVVAGSGKADGARFIPGEVWFHTSDAEWHFDGEADLVLAYPGDHAIDAAWQQVKARAVA